MRPDHVLVAPSVGRKSRSGLVSASTKPVLAVGQPRRTALTPLVSRGPQRARSRRGRSQTPVPIVFADALAA